MIERDLANWISEKRQIELGDLAPLYPLTCIRNVIRESIVAERERIIKLIVDVDTTNGLTYPDGTIDEGALRDFLK